MSLRQRYVICPDGVVRRFHNFPQSSDDDPILTLGIEAMAAGDEKQVQICYRALKGDKQAIAQCERVIATAKAQIEK